MTATAVKPPIAYKTGRRTKLTPINLRRYLDLLTQGEGRYKAARKLHLDPGHLRRYSLAEPEFAQAILDAEAEFTDEIEAVLKDKALEGEQWAVIKWLESDRAQGRWLPPAVRSQLQVNVSGTVALEARLANVNELAERLEARRAELAALSGRALPIEATATEA